MNKIPLHNDSLEIIGHTHLEGRLPSHLMIGQDLYERYGQVNNYRYILIPTGSVLTLTRSEVLWT